MATSADCIEAEFSIVAYTDGSCTPNPGPGGWGVLMQALKGSEVVKEREISGGASQTTNNQMELTAAIEALEALSRPTRITIKTDSQYLRNGITRWILGWKRNGWVTQGKKPVQNRELWQRLDAATSKHEVHWDWVKGHASDVGNNRADKLAREGMQPYKPSS